MIDNIGIKGVFEVKVFKKNTLIEHYIDNNLVVTLGKNSMTKLISSADTDKIISYISFGTSIINPTVADSTITNEYLKLLDGFEYPNSKSVKFNWVLETTENNGVSISEFGLKTADDTLFSRVVRGAIEKESDVYLSGSWTISFV